MKELVLNAHNHIKVGGYGGLMERYVDPKESHQKHLEANLRNQWGWRTIIGIAAFFAVYALIMVDLEVDPFQLISKSVTYISLPPNFSNFGELMKSMLETVDAINSQFQ